MTLGEFYIVKEIHIWAFLFQNFQPNTWYVCLLSSTIRDKIIPHAVSWFTGEAVQEDEFEGIEDDDDEDEDDVEDDDEEDDEDDDEEDDDEDEEETKGKSRKKVPFSYNTGTFSYYTWLINGFLIKIA